MALQVYDAANVNVTINNGLVTGFGSDSLVQCTFVEDRVIPYDGVKGEYAYSMVNSTAGQIVITLSHISPWNGILQNLANSKSVFPVSVSDINIGGFIAGAAECVIQTAPTWDRGSEIATQTWTIYAFDFTIKPQ